MALVVFLPGEKGSEAGSRKFGGSSGASHEKVDTLTRGTNTLGRPPKTNSLTKEEKLDRIRAKGTLIFKALVIYASHNSGLYPEGDNANEALGELVDGMGTENPFFIKGSKWHGQNFANGPDNKWEYSEPPGIALEAGENAWSFSAGESAETDAIKPILATTILIEGECYLIVVHASGRTKSEMISPIVHASTLFPAMDMLDPLPPPGGLKE